MDNFLKISGSIVIATGLGLAFSFPGFAVGIAMGWIFINENLKKEQK